MSEYRKLRTASGEMGDVARVAEARCMARMGSRLSQARDQVKAVLNDRGTKTDKVYAQAHVVLGNIKLQQAKESGKSEDVKAALLEYLRVILLYSDQETAMPEALYQAAKACDLLGDAGRRAQQYRTQLQRSFSDSSWARKL
jgi:hypothetical protein